MNNQQDNNKPSLTVVPSATPAAQVHAPELTLPERVALILTEDGLSQRQLAEALDLTSATVNRWLGGAKVESQEALETAVVEWMGQRELRRKSLSTSDREVFVQTATAERIASALAYAQAYRDMVSVYGGPGVGKTRTIHWFRQQYEGVFIATATPATASVVPALEGVAEALGISDPVGGARRIARRIRAEGRDTQSLIVIDEAQHLTTGAIEELRSIHDATKVGLALVGNETSYARLTGNRAASFAQIHSRIGMRLMVRKPSAADVAAIAKHWKVTDEDSLALLERIASRPGALRSVTKVLRLAGAGTHKLTFSRLRAAADNLGADA